MINKKICFFATLLCLFSAVTHCCLEMVALKKQQAVFKSLYLENLELKHTLIKKELESRKSHVIGGWKPAASAFFNAIYNAKKSSDVDRALMDRGEFYIKHYRAEQIEECSALGIITMAEMPFPEKKICIQKLSNYEFRPTLRDKELALLEKCKRCSNQMCERMILLGYILEKHRKDFFKSSRKKFKSSRKSRQRFAFFLFNLEESLF